MYLGIYYQLAICMLMGAVPVAGWGYIFFHKRKSDRYSMILTFLVGGLAVFPILLYKYSWQFFPWMNAFLYADKFSNHIISLGSLIAIPASVLITFMIVGIIEEWMKHWVVRIADDQLIKSIDDAILFSIVAALGFAFVENILYFYDIWLVHGANDLVLPFIFRSMFSTFAHVMFSGIFGYYYGIAHFASPILQEEITKKRNPVLRMMHRALKFRTASVFSKEKILEGLIYASVLHAVFNVALELNLAFVLVPYLSGGYLILDYLLKKKENHKLYDSLTTKKATAKSRG